MVAYKYVYVVVCMVYTFLLCKPCFFSALYKMKFAIKTKWYYKVFQ